MKKMFSLIIIYLCSFKTVSAAHMYLEKDYQNAWSNRNNGIVEYVLPDSTRVDCVTKDYAIEFDFAKKWEESIGQSLYYGLVLHKKPGVVIILEHPLSDQKYLTRLNAVAKQYGITVWTITPAYLVQR